MITLPWIALRDCGTAYEQVVADEISNRIASMVASGDEATRREALHLVGGIAWDAPLGLWQRWGAEQIDSYATEIIAEAAHDKQLLQLALHLGVISVEQALTMPGGFDTLAEFIRPKYTIWSSLPYIISLAVRPRHDEEVISDFAAIGRHLVDHPTLPWIHIATKIPLSALDPVPDSPPLDELSGLGAAAAFAISTELADSARSEPSGLPMPVPFRQLFKDWAEGRVNFIEDPAESR